MESGASGLSWEADENDETSEGSEAGEEEELGDVEEYGDISEDAEEVVPGAENVDSAV